MSDIIVNKVAQSGIVTIDLELYKEKDAVVPFDLKPFLFKEMILREKDFRASMKTLDWTTYSAKNVAIFCSVDAIIPMWAYMLIVTNLEEVDRSEEHTSELQSRPHLVCRLLLEKKKNSNRLD